MKILMAAMGLEIGGAETHIVELTRELLRRGHEVTVASNGGVYEEDIVKAGARHVKVPMHKRNPFLMAKSLFLLWRLIRKERPDVVHAHARIPAFLCGILKKFMDFPFVTTAHWVFSTDGALRSLTNWGDRTVAVSEDIKKYLMDSYGVPEARISVTVNGIDTEKFSPELTGEAFRAEQNIPADAPVVVHVSRLDESRADAAAGLVRISQRLSSRVPGVVIVIVGDGGKLEELRARAEEANLKIGRRCVILTGSRTDINNVCAAADAFVGVSRAALEAMACGKLCVLAGNEGCMGLFDEDKLEKCKAENFCCRGGAKLTDDALLDDVTTALTLPLEETERLAQVSRRVAVEEYSVSRMAEDALAAYAAVQPGDRVVLSGYYGFHNAGDEAILGELVGSVRRLSPGAEITVLSKDPKGTAAAHGCRAIPRFSPFKILRAVCRCELLISGGGSLFQDSTSTRSLLYYTGILALAQKLGKRTYLYANGVGPVTRESNRRLVRRVVEAADAVTLRDPDSLEELRRMGCEREDILVTADPVFNLPLPDPKRAREILDGAGVDGPYVVASLRPCDVPEGYFENLAKALDLIAQKYKVRVVFVAMQPKRDEPVSWDVSDMMETDATVLSGDFTPQELMGVIGRAQAVLSMRLHALIFAARTATPALGFVYDPKVASYLALLHQPSAGSGDMDSGAVANAVGVILDHREELSARLEETCRDLTRAAAENDVILKALLDVK